jgi:hypothetical protein
VNLIYPVVVKPFNEIMELLPLHGPKCNIKAAGNYLSADRPFGGEHGYFNTVSKRKSKILTSDIRSKISE